MPPSPWEITRDMFLSVDEVEQLLDHVRKQVTRPSPREHARASVDRLIIEVLLFSGLRCSEFCRLRLSDAVLDSGGGLLTVSGGQECSRGVWIPPHVAVLLREHVRHVRPALLPADLDPRAATGPLVVGERRQAYERSGLYRRVVRILTQAGLGARASVQLLRHTYAYLAYLRTGGNLLFVQRQLGHVHPMITAIYAQFVEEDYAVLARSVGEPNSLPRMHRTRSRPRRSSGGIHE